MRSPFALLLTAALLCPAPFARADLKDAARKTLTRYGPALVTVRLTTRTRIVYQGKERTIPESTMDVEGTVLSADGLTVLSDFASNPGGALKHEGGPQMQTETSAVKLLLQDGRELPARVVLRDPDLDLAFVAPQDPQTALAFVKFEKGPVPEPLDDLIVLSQLGRSLGREVAVTLTRVRAVLKKPRTFVVPSALEGLLGLGGPAFDDRGRPVGLIVMRRTAHPSADFQGLNDVFDLVSAVVLSASDVQEMAEQAAAARARPVTPDEASEAAPAP
ncbi:MAG TPA: serine protease [Anaeromyxobacter sp.]|nr:serine protease [Anaeromyxobacter sp.]